MKVDAIAKVEKGQTGRSEESWWSISQGYMQVFFGDDGDGESICSHHQY